MAEPKEGVDFELVLAKNQPKGGTNKTRRFFTKAEKQAKSAPPASVKPPVKVKEAPKKASPKPAPKKTPVTKDAMQGYRAGDITTSKLPAAPSKKPAAKPTPDYQPPPRADAPKGKPAVVGGPSNPVSRVAARAGKALARLLQ